MRRNRDNCRSLQRPGIVLLVTLVLLVVLSTLAYTLSARVAAQRHRDQYILDYSQARYSCDSAVKYALATLEELEPTLISRPNVPDFSDLFALDEEQYQELLAEIAAQSGFGESDEEEGLGSFRDLARALDDESVEDVNEAGGDSSNAEGELVKQIEITGPYGPPWPFVAEPAEFEMGTATVRMEIEDENAKYPLGWALLDDAKIKREAEAGFETFCEWMKMSSAEIEYLADQLKEIGEIRPFKVDFKPITRTVRTTVETPAPSTATAASRTASRTTARRRTPRTQIRRTTLSVPAQIAEQTSFYARLLHSSMVDRDLLARPIVVSETRQESALKYAGMWGTMKVNINTAPR